MSVKKTPRIPLPKSWTSQVRSAMLQVISLAQYATVYTRSWAVESINERVRLKAESDRLRQELALQREEIRIKDARMARIVPHRRPHYSPTERMAILELRAARGWSLEQTAKTFLVTDATIGTWMKRIDEEGTAALVQLRQPVNRFPDFVRYAVQRLKTLCPTMGKVKIAQVLSRAGLHLGVTTVGRILKEPPGPKPKPATSAIGRVVTAREPGRVWHIDLTVVPIGKGFWTSWMPFALSQQWPFCWWCAVIVDHYSRRIMKIGLFANRPNCRAICTLLGQTVRQAGAAPKYLVCDKESIFDCDAFRGWVKRKGIKPPRYGAVGRHGSIAVVERLILTMKNECTRKIVIPMQRTSFRRELDWFTLWYNAHRPHMTLAGATPDEVHFRLRVAHRQPRIEPRKDWPRRSPCAHPRTLIAGQPGDRFGLEVKPLGRRRHLPIVTLQRAA